MCPLACGAYVLSALLRIKSRGQTQPSVTRPMTSTTGENNAHKQKGNESYRQCFPERCFLLAHEYSERLWKDLVNLKGYTLILQSNPVSICSLGILELFCIPLTSVVSPTLTHILSEKDSVEGLTLFLENPYVSSTIWSGKWHIGWLGNVKAGVKRVWWASITLHSATLAQRSQNMSKWVLQ